MAYESAQAERERQDAEKAAANKARQIRLGDIPRPEASETAATKEEEEKPKAKSGSRAKTTE